MTHRKHVWVVIGLVLCCGGGSLTYFLVATTIGRAEVRFAMGSRLNALTKAALAYAQDNDDRLPPRLALAAETEPFLRPFIGRNNADGDWSAFRMNSFDNGPTLGNGWLESQRVANIVSPEHTVLFYTTPDFPDGKRWAGFVDGKVREVRGRGVDRAMESAKGLLGRTDAVIR